MNLEELLATDEEGFRSIVDNEVRGRLDLDAAKLLRDPQVIDRWRLTLIAMKNSVEAQLGAKRDDLSSKDDRGREEFKRWKAGALRFKNGVEDRLLEIRLAWLKIYRTNASEWIREERNEALFAVKLLTDAIKQHKDATITEYGHDEIGEADLDLWQTIGV